jgi:hypothetical protein
MILSSSVVEQTTVNRLAIGSSPIWGERKKWKLKKESNEINFFLIVDRQRRLSSLIMSTAFFL